MYVYEGMKLGEQQQRKIVQKAKQCDARELMKTRNRTVVFRMDDSLWKA